MCDSLNSTPGLISGPFDCSTPNRSVSNLQQYPDLPPIRNMTNKYIYFHLQVLKIKRKKEDITESGVHTIPVKRIKEEKINEEVKSIKKATDTKKQPVKRK